MGLFSLSRRPRRTDLIQQATRGITKARRQGHHTYYGDWHLDLEAEARQITANLLTWCRDTLASCRRPFGIDYFDLRVTLGDGAYGSLSLKELRPAALYAATLEERIQEFLERRLTLRSQTAPPLKVSTALFSWGDAANEALPATW